MQRRFVWMLLVTGSVAESCCLLLAQEAAQTLRSDSNARLIAGPAKVKREIKAPDEIVIRQPEGKPGQVEMHEIFGQGYKYSYDRGTSENGRLRLFDIERRRRNQSIPTLDLNWSTTSDVEDGQLYSFLGQVYRWNGKASKMIRIPDHPSALTMKEPETRIAVFRDLYLSLPDNWTTHLQLTITGFNTSGDPTADSVGVRVNVDDKQRLQLPDQSEVAETGVTALAE